MDNFKAKVIFYTGANAALANKAAALLYAAPPPALNTPTLQSQPQELLPAPFSARASVHEYGGGEFLVFEDTLFFINADDQQIYQTPIQAPSETLPTPRALTAEPQYRFTNICMDQARNRLICVAEIHPLTSKAGQHPENSLVTIDLSAPLAERVSPFVQGHDFYASPTISPNGKTLTWLCWDLPQMPWETAALFIADLDDKGTITQTTQITGTGHDAAFQPQWHQDGSLYFIWDKTGWGNLYRWTLDKTVIDQPDPMLDLPFDFGQPQWIFGMKKYAILPSGQIALAFFKEGITKTGILDPKTKIFSEHDSDKYNITGLEQVVATPSGFAGLALHHSKPQSIVELCLLSSKTNTIQVGSTTTLTEENISKGTAFKFKNEKGQTIFGVFYPPTNQDYTGKTNTLPPCIFNVHGGPSGATSRGLNLKTQYWTNRGFAWCDIDYSGSTGYGKAYRERLDGQWGIADVQDIISGAQHLIKTDKVHPQQCVISGSSAGGLTVLNALATSTIFRAGVSYYGVTDLLKLQETTHKFEAGYLFKLIGCTPKNYRDILPLRSPSSQAKAIKTPVLFFQGSKDAVVPPEQAQSMSTALEQNNIPTKIFIFEGEGHGFRQKETVIETLRQELKFYTQIFDL